MNFLIIYICMQSEHAVQNNYKLGKFSLKTEVIIDESIIEAGHTSLTKRVESREKSGSTESIYDQTIDPKHGPRMGF